MEMIASRMYATWRVRNMCFLYGTIQYTRALCRSLGLVGVFLYTKIKYMSP